MPTCNKKINKNVGHIFNDFIFGTREISTNYWKLYYKKISKIKLLVQN